MLGTLPNGKSGGLAATGAGGTRSTGGIHGAFDCGTAGGDSTGGGELANAGAPADTLGTVTIVAQFGQRACPPAAEELMRSSFWHCGQRNSIRFAAAAAADGYAESVMTCFPGRLTMR